MGTLPLPTEDQTHPRPHPHFITYKRSGQSSTAMVRASQWNKKTVSKDMETVVSNSPDEEIHERIETNKNNNFSISGENENEEERTSKGQEDSETKTNT